MLIVYLQEIIYLRVYYYCQTTHVPKCHSCNNLWGSFGGCVLNTHIKILAECHVKTISAITFKKSIAHSLLINRNRIKFVINRDLIIKPNIFLVSYTFEISISEIPFVLTSTCLPMKFQQLDQFSNNILNKSLFCSRCCRLAFTYILSTHDFFRFVLLCA